MTTKLRIQWQPNPVAEQVFSYEVRIILNGAVQPLVETANTFYEFENLGPGSYQFAVRAKNLAGAGSYSNTVNGPALPTPPTGVEISTSVVQ